LSFLQPIVLGSGESKALANCRPDPFRFAGSPVISGVRYGFIELRVNPKTKAMGICAIHVWCHRYLYLDPGPEGPESEETHSETEASKFRSSGRR